MLPSGFTISLDGRLDQRWSCKGSCQPHSPVIIKNHYGQNRKWLCPSPWLLHLSHCSKVCWGLSLAMDFILLCCVSTGLILLSSFTSIMEIRRNSWWMFLCWDLVPLQWMVLTLHFKDNLSCSILSVTPQTHRYDISLHGHLWHATKRPRAIFYFLFPFDFKIIISNPVLKWFSDFWFLKCFQVIKFSIFRVFSYHHLIFNKIWSPFSFWRATFEFSLIFKMF